MKKNFYLNNVKYNNQIDLENVIKNVDVSKTGLHLILATEEDYNNADCLTHCILDTNKLVELEKEMKILIEGCGESKPSCKIK